MNKLDVGRVRRSSLTNNNPQMATLARIATMSEAKNPTPEADKSRETDPYSRLLELERKAEELDIPNGWGRAAWVLSRWRETTDAQFFGTTASGKTICRECGCIPSEKEEGHTGWNVHPSGPRCPRCAILRLKQYLR